MHAKPVERLAFAALLAGASGIGFAPIFVRWSEVGPVATAFYRVGFALPVLGLWMGFENQRAASDRSKSPAMPSSWCQKMVLARWAFVAAGSFFAADLAIWHWSLRLTTVANSTLITNFTPFFVMFGARLLFQERITRLLLGGLALALAGGTMLVGSSLQLTLDHVLGDLLALVTAVFYAGYLLAVKHLRRTFSTATTMTGSGLVSCPLFLVVAVLSAEPLAPHTGRGWVVLVALALVSHVGGQGLIAYALAHLPASFSAVGLLVQPVVAAVLAWVLLGERLQTLQVFGGVLILAGIAVASRATR